VAIDPRMVVSLGPLALPVMLLLQVAKSFGIAVAEPRPTGRHAISEETPDDDRAARLQLRGSQNRSIGRTPTTTSS